MQVKKLEITDMRMSKFMRRVIKNNKVINQRIREPAKVSKISKKAQESQLKRFNHAEKRSEECVGKRVVETEVEETRREGRPREISLDCRTEDLSEKRQTGKEAANRAWETADQKHRPHTKVGIDGKKR